MNQSRRRVAIAGCGMGGPAAAVLLARAGWEVTVLERAPVLGPVGAGILLQPTGLSLLARLGLLDAARALGRPVRRLDARTPMDGNATARDAWASRAVQVPTYPKGNYLRSRSPNCAPQRLRVPSGTRAGSAMRITGGARRRRSGRAGCIVITLLDGGKI